MLTGVRLAECVWTHVSVFDRMGPFVDARGTVLCCDGRTLEGRCLQG